MCAAPHDDSAATAGRSVLLALTRATVRTYACTQAAFAECIEWMALP